MEQLVVAVSGRIASGKSTLAADVAAATGGGVVRTRVYLEQHADRGDRVDRIDLQRVGAQLDDDHGGSWVVAAVEASGVLDLPVVVVDAVRTLDQVVALRKQYGRRVQHVHVTAPPAELEQRFERRRDRPGEGATYAEIVEHATERVVEDLGSRADIVVDTARARPEDVKIRCLARLGLLGVTTGPVCDFVVGGQYGSEGKGNIAFHLAPEYDVLVRVGGPNAGHKVPAPGGGVFTHRSLPSGTLSNPNAELVIGPGATLDLDVLAAEVADTGARQRLRVDPQAVVIEPVDVAAESAGMAAIGSTGSGAGAAASRRIMARVTDGEVRLARDVADLQDLLTPTADVLRRAAERGRRVLVEGTQGAGLSLFHGAYPHVTSRDTNVGGLLAEVGLPAACVRQVVMVCRTYPIRVKGASGPMAQEIDFGEIAARSGNDADELTTSEHSSVTNRLRRVAEFDWVQLRRSAELNGATDVALTFVDYLDVANKQAYRFDQLTPQSQSFVQEVESVSGARVSVLSAGFNDGRGIIDRRTWRGYN